MNTRLSKILGWGPDILVGLFMILASGAPKIFMYNDPSLRSFTEPLGAADILLPIGIMEVLFAVLLLIPRTTTIGFVLLVGLLGGAFATGLTHTAQGNMPFFPFILLLLLTLSSYFRRPELLERLGKKS